jgi:phage shock protein A
VHPVISEFCRVNAIQNMKPEFFRKTQRLLRDEVQPLLDEREKLIDTVHSLEEQVASLTKQLEAKRGRKAAEPATVAV